MRLARAAGSHTGALLAASDATVDALFAQSGVIRTDTLGELFDVAGLLARQPPPAGPRVGVVTNGGGLGILCADACDAAGLDLTPTPTSVQVALRAELPEGAAVGNPLDLLATARPSDFALAIELLAASGAADSIIVLHVPLLVTDSSTASVPFASRAAPARDARESLSGRHYASLGDIVIADGDVLVGLVTIKALMAADDSVNAKRPATLRPRGMLSMPRLDLA